MTRKYSRKTTNYRAGNCVVSKEWESVVNTGCANEKTALRKLVPILAVVVRI